MSEEAIAELLALRLQLIEEKENKRRRSLFRRNLRGTFELTFLHEYVPRKGYFHWDPLTERDILTISLPPESLGIRVRKAVKAVEREHEWGKIEVKEEAEQIEISFDYLRRSYARNHPPEKRIENVLGALFWDKFSNLEIMEIKRQRNF